MIDNDSKILSEKYEKILLEVKVLNNKIDKPLKLNDTIRVYHGVNNPDDVFEFLQKGLSGKDKAKRIYSYEYNNNPYGLFVTKDLKVAKKFANIIIEFQTKISDLENPVWPGGSYTIQGQKEQYWNSQKKDKNFKKEKEKS